jgi:hypothetical protein
LKYAKSDDGLHLTLGLLIVELDEETARIPPAKKSCHIDFLLYYHSNLQLETRMRWFLDLFDELNRLVDSICSDVF